MSRQALPCFARALLAVRTYDSLLEQVYGECLLYVQVSPLRHASSSRAPQTNHGGCSVCWCCFFWLVTSSLGDVTGRKSSWKLRKYWRMTDFPPMFSRDNNCTHRSIHRLHRCDEHQSGQSTNHGLSKYLDRFAWSTARDTHSWKRYTRQYNTKLWPHSGIKVFVWNNGLVYHVLLLLCFFFLSCCQMVDSRLTWKVQSELFYCGVM